LTGLWLRQADRRAAHNGVVDRAELSRNIETIRNRIAKACQSAGRRDDVTLIAVTKTVPIELIQLAYELGMQTFGESRLQEAEPKVASLPHDIEWHFIGHLQSNKAKRVAELFSAIHTLRSEEQLKAIAKQSREVQGLIEVNIAEEPQKSGISLSEVANYCKRVIEYDQVHLRGLMTIGPNLGDAEAMRPFFRRMREANEAIDGTWLSMGMSNDFEVAIQEGATHVRVGSAIFGARQ
jgi:pyridoxal phosphate enzyme (YggS family)